MENIMTCQTIQDLANQGAKIVDVRTEGEFAAGNIANSINIPLSAFETVDTQLSKDIPVLLYCRSGSRSEMAKNYLNANGYNATNIGGINQFIGCLS